MQGREHEWAFNNKAGLLHTARSQELGRLIAVHLNRGHRFAGIKEVKVSKRLMLCFMQSVYRMTSCLYLRSPS